MITARGEQNDSQEASAKFTLLSFFLQNLLGMLVTCGNQPRDSGKCSPQASRPCGPGMNIKVGDFPKCQKVIQQKVLGTTFTKFTWKWLCECQLRGRIQYDGSTP